MSSGGYYDNSCSQSEMYNKIKDELGNSFVQLKITDYKIEIFATSFPNDFHVFLYHTLPAGVEKKMTIVPGPDEIFKELLR